MQKYDMKQRIAFLAYALATVAFLPLFMLWSFLHCLLVPARRLQYRQKLGIEPPGFGAKKKRRVWIHAVSVGEIVSISPLVRLMRESGLEVLVSTGTTTGFDTARKILGARPFYFPLDVSFICRRFLTRIEPDAILICEVEIWPAFAWSAHEKQIPLYLIGGRMVDRDYGNYKRARWLFSPVLSCYSGLFMQTAEYARRMRRLCESHPNIRVSGSLKFDAAPEPTGQDLGGLLPGGKILCALSTHPGDERIVLDAFLQVAKSFPDLKLVVAPRHLNRVGEIVRLAKNRGLAWELRTRNRACQADVFILDTLGEVKGVFAHCDLVVMGGSFSSRHGGHNAIEPALGRCCVLCGPHMENFLDVHRLFLDRKAVFATTKETLADDVRLLLEHPDKAEKIGERAFGLVREQRGACLRTLAAVFGPGLGRPYHPKTDQTRMVWLP